MATRLMQLPTTNRRDNATDINSMPHTHDCMSMHEFPSGFNSEHSSCQLHNKNSSDDVHQYPQYFRGHMYNHSYKDKIKISIFNVTNERFLLKKDDDTNSEI
jgi:hypothetical protein